MSSSLNSARNLLFYIGVVGRISQGHARRPVPRLTRDVSSEPEVKKLWYRGISTPYVERYPGRSSLVL